MWVGKVLAAAIAPLVAGQWSYEGAAGGFASAAAVATDSVGLLYVGNRDGFVRALHSDNGTVLWAASLDGSSVTGSPVVVNGTVYAGSYGNAFYALDAATGAVRWRYAVGGTVASSPVVDEARGSVIFACHDSYVYALDIRTGSVPGGGNATGVLKWRFRADFSVHASPALEQATGAVFASSWDAYLYKLDAGGALLWKLKVGSGLDAAPVLSSDGRLVFCGSRDRYLYAVDTATGRTAWRFLTGDQVTATAVTSPWGFLYVGGRDGFLYCLHQATGAQRWRRDLGGWVVATAALLPAAPYYPRLNTSHPDVTADGLLAAEAGGLVFAGSVASPLYALDCVSGAVRWAFGTATLQAHSPAVLLPPRPAAAAAAAAAAARAVAFSVASICRRTPSTPGSPHSPCSFATYATACARRASSDVAISAGVGPLAAAAASAEAAAAADMPRAPARQFVCVFEPALGSLAAAAAALTRKAMSMGLGAAPSLPPPPPPPPPLVHELAAAAAARIIRLRRALRS
jgi:outer membrane protein assembly factor BamB